VTSQVFIDVAMTPGLGMLPASMDTPEARALLIAIALQESGLVKRRQLGGGPGRSFFQFEKVGVRALLKHERSKTHLRDLCTALDVNPNYITIHRALEFADLLAVGCARLLLWTDPHPLPAARAPEDAWAIYRRCWNPGRPRRETWDAHYAVAWHVITGEPL